jgi:hypothetical protein
MLVIGLGIGMIVAGVMALIRGRLQLSNTKAVQGAWAYLLGLALMAALPLGFCVVMVYMLMHVDPNRKDEMDKWANENDLTLTLILAGVEIGVGLIVVIIGACLATPLPRDEGRHRRREPEYDDEYEGRSRKRRTADDYEDDDRPRRRRREYDDREGRPRRDNLDERAQ